MMMAIAAEPTDTLVPIWIQYAGEWTKIITILLALSPLNLKQSIELFFNPIVSIIIEILLLYLYVLALRNKIKLNCNLTQCKESYK